MGWGWWVGGRELHLCCKGERVRCEGRNIFLQTKRKNQGGVQWYTL